MTNQFAERYKTLGVRDLLKIIDNPGDYQPAAVEAAENELTTRHLSKIELADAVTQNEQDKIEQQAQADSKNAFGNKVKATAVTLADAINPIQQTPPSINRVINILSAVYAILFLVQVFSEFDLMNFMLTSKEAKWNIDLIPYLLPLTLLPIATALFWRRKKWGWGLLGVFLSYSVLGSLVLYFMLLKYTPVSPAVDNLAPISASSAIYHIAFFAACLWFLFKREIREIYQIDKRMIILTVGMGALLTMLTIYCR